MDRVSIADPRVQAQLVLKRFRARLETLTPLKKEVATKVVVTSGLLAGEDVSLKCTNCVIGSGDESDILLVDDGIEEKHVAVAFNSSVLGPIVSVEAFSRDVRLDGTSVDPGKKTDFRSIPIELSIGNATLEIRRPDGGEKKINPYLLKSMGYMRYGVVAAIVLASVFWFIDYSDFNYTVTPRASMEYDLVLPEQAVTDEMEQEITLIGAKLNDLGLMDFVRVGFRPDGQIGANGVIPKDMETTWLNFRKWHDSRSPTVMVSDVETAVDFAALPAIAMLDYSEPRALILLNGGRVEIGQNLTNDLVLEDITDSEIVVSRNNRRMKLLIGN